MVNQTEYARWMEMCIVVVSSRWIQGCGWAIIMFSHCLQYRWQQSQLEVPDDF